MEKFNKTVLITGSTSGFGRKTAELLHSLGYKVIITGRRKELLDEISNSLSNNVHVAQLDVRDKESIKNFFATLPEGFKEVDVLVNNAGLARGLDSVDAADISDWDEMVDTNIKGLLYMTREVIGQMKSRNTGLIINIGSVAATVPYKGGNVYGATKAFVKQFTRNLRTDLFGTKIKATNIEPGMAETEFSLVRFHGDKDKASSVYANTHALTAENIAETIRWVIEQPQNVNIDNIEIMPVDQTFAGMVINRQV